MSLGLNPYKLLFIDECGTHLNMQSDYARSPKGQRAYAKRPYHDGERINLISGLSLEGIQAPWLVKNGPIDGLTFLTYVEHILLPTLREGQIIIVDNYSIHKSEAVRVMIEQAGCELKFLPTYSPDLNPIALAFSKIKAFLRHIKPQSFEELSCAFVSAFKAISLADVCGWFRHAGYQAL